MIQKSAGGVMTRFFYNVEDRLVRVEDGFGNVIAQYDYDPFGRRLWKDVSGTRTYFHYSDEGLVGEYDAAGSVIKTYGWQPGSTWGTDPLFMRQDGKYYWYHNDHLGTPQKMTSSSGAVVWRANYTAFGHATVDSNSTVINNLRFPGQMYDEETGLHYNYHRYYDPKTGRYLAQDPIGLFGGINLYAYVENNPINQIDPSGLAPKDKRYGLPKRFWQWYHRNVKKPGDPDLSKEDAEDLYDEWTDRGKPGPDTKKKKRVRKRGRGVGIYAPTFHVWCANYPEDCADLMEQLSGNALNQCEGQVEE